MNLKIKILIGLFFSITLLKAQSPDLINYQAVARDLSGNPLVSTPVNVTYDIRQSTPTGTIVYSETHSLTTNQFGLFIAPIGGGTPVTGTFPGITWGTGLYYLQVTINGDVMPATQLLSVPYALYSKESANGPPGANGHANLADSVSEPAGANCANGGYLIHMGADDNDDGTLQALERDISYYICNGLDGSANTNDTSATNELQTISISATNDTIFLSNGGFIVLPNAAGDNWGTQVVITSGANISGDGTSGNPLVVTDSVIDADADPNNERITTFSVNGTNDSLIIVESGVGHAMPLSDLSDGDWTNGVGSDIFNNTDSIGIGTTNPKSIFQIGSNMHLFPFSLPGPEDYAVNSYNSHHTGTIIRNTTGGVSGFSFLGHKNGQPNYGVHLFASQPAGTDMTSLNPDLKINLSNKGFGVYVDNPDAAIDVEPIDSAGIILRMANNGSTSHLFFEDTQTSQVGLRSPNLLTSNYVLTLPTNLPSTSGSSLVSDLAGNLSWATSPTSFWSSTNAGSIHPTNINDNIGLGVNNPTSPLTINTIGGTEIEFVGGSNADITAPSQLNLISGASTLFDASIFNFYTASTHRMTILNNGNVGIGTASPSTRFVVAGGNMILRDQTDVVDAVELASGTGAGASGSIGIRSSGVNTVFLTGTGSSWFNAGRLGVGTNSPLERFHVFEQTNLDVLFESATGLADFTIDAAVNRADIIFKRSGATEGSMGYNLTNDYLFLNDGVESLVSRNGNIGIGTNTPSSKLNIVTNPNITLLELEGSGLVGGGLHFTYRGTTEGYEIRADDQGGINMEASGNHKISFETSGTERMRITGPGDVGIGTTTPSEKLDVVGDVIANNYKYATPKTRFLTIGEADFRMIRSWAGDIESTFGLGGVGIVNATGSNALIAPVYLPDGAVVTGIEVYYVDNSASSMTVYFERRGLTGGASSISTGVTTGATTAVQTLNLIGTTINNANNSYNIRVFSSGWPTNTTKTMDIKTVKITYTITETD